MRVVLFLLMFSALAWAGDKHKTDKPKSSPKSEHQLSKEEVATVLPDTVFVRETFIEFPGPEKSLRVPVWQYEMKGSTFPGGSLPFFVPPQPTISQVLCAFISSLSTTETYISLMKDAQKKSDPVPPPGI